GAGPYNAIALTSGNLTIGSNITVRGDTGYIGYSPAIGGNPATINVINQGTIQFAATSNIQIPANLTNNATIFVASGATFAPGGTIIGGTITSQAGAQFGSVTLD